MQPRNLHLTLAFIGPLDDAAAALVAGASGGLVQRRVRVVDRCAGLVRARASRLGRRLQQLELDAAAACARAHLDELAIRLRPQAVCAARHAVSRRAPFDCSGPLTPPLAWRTATIALYAASTDAAGPIYRKVRL